MEKFQNQYIFDTDISPGTRLLGISGLYLDRSVPVQLLSVLENWLSMCMSCVKWGSAFSYFYEMKSGVRQGGVLSPFLFAIFIDDL